MTDSRIQLKNPLLAAVLAFLLPGLGHLYQGRLFKAVIYSVCICGMFITGSSMAEWKAVQAPPFDYREKGRNLLALKFAAQAGVGLPALASIVQTRRYLSGSNELSRTIPAPFSTLFEGELMTFSPQGRTTQKVKGTVHLEPTQGGLGETTIGTFEGTSDAGQPLKLTLDYGVNLDRPYDSSPDRELRADVVTARGDARTPVGTLVGYIPRPALNWVGMPLNDAAAQVLEGRLGKWHELALVLTWIAGLLNILAIWDALEGPAYGYSDHSDGPDEEVAQKPAARPAAVARKSAPAVP